MQSGRPLKATRGIFGRAWGLPPCRPRSCSTATSPQRGVAKRHGESGQGSDFRQPGLHARELVEATVGPSRAHKQTLEAPTSHTPAPNTAAAKGSQNARAEEVGPSPLPSNPTHSELKGKGVGPGPPRQRVGPAGPNNSSPPRLGVATGSSDGESRRGVATGSSDGE